MKQIYNRTKKWRFAEDFIEYLKERGMQNEHIVF